MSDITTHEQGHPHAVQVPNNDTPIDMEEIVAFAKRVRAEQNAALSMREYARKHMSWEMEFERILEAVDGGMRA